MSFDLRATIGLFTILGVQLMGYGLITHGSAMYARSLGSNINLEWGAVLLTFGAGMWWLGRRRPVDDAAEITPVSGPGGAGPGSLS